MYKGPITSLRTLGEEKGFSSHDRYMKAWYGVLFALSMDQSIGHTQMTYFKT